MKREKTFKTNKSNVHLLVFDWFFLSVCTFYIRAIATETILPTYHHVQCSHYVSELCIYKDFNNTLNNWSSIWSSENSKSETEFDSDLNTQTHTTIPNQWICDGGYTRAHCLTKRIYFVTHFSPFLIADNTNSSCILFTAKKWNKCRGL